MINKNELVVIGSLQEDIDKSIVRIASERMDELGLRGGDFVELTGKSSVLVRVMRAITRTISEDAIRLDGSTRSNIGVSLGDKVTIKKVNLVEAKTVSLSPLQEGIRFSDDPTEYFHIKLLNHPLNKDQAIVIDVFGTRLNYVVSKLTPKNSFVSPSTKIIVSNQVYSGDTKSTGISYEDVGGLKKEVSMVREMVELPMKHPEIFQKLGVGAPKGVLMTGPPGTGKTLLAKAVAGETDASFFSIAGPEIMSKFYGESEKKVREVFENAEKNAPSIIFIDEIDAIAPKRGGGTDQTEKRIVAQILTLMDGLKSRGQVVVMAATNRPDDIDPALRRPGRFDRELKINPPDESGRKEILQIHTRGMPLGKNVNFDELSRKTVGYTGADVEVLCKEAALKSLKPYFSELKNMQEKVPTKILDNIKVSEEDFLEALKQVEPSAMREVLINKPHVHWEDIGGLESVKEKLRELIELPLLRPDLFEQAGIKPSKGILLYGPPGTGKTLLAKAVATEANANFISVKGPELFSKWVGESEKHVRDIFKRAKQVAPCIIFFDEFDSLSKKRNGGGNDSTEKVVNQLLSELDGVEELKKVMIVAATNRKDLIDPALLRPGRIDSIVEIKIPDKESRKKIFKVHTKGMPLSKDVHIEDFVDKTDGWTGADINAFAREAGINAIKRFYKKKKAKIVITKEDFDNAFKTVEENVESRKKKSPMSMMPNIPKMSQIPKKKVVSSTKDNKKVKKVKK